MKLNLDSLIVADKYAPEAEVVYIKKDGKVKIRISQKARTKYLDGAERVHVAYDYSQGFLAICKPNDVSVESSEGRALIVNDNGHGYVDFQHSAFPDSDKVLLNNLEFDADSGFYGKKISEVAEVSAS
jgi:hypothetical protein